jgi:hypothetical protein
MRIFRLIEAFEKCSILSKVSYSPDWGVISNRSARRFTGRLLEASGSGRDTLRPPERNRHELFHIGALALGTTWGRITGSQHELFKAVAAVFTFIFINRHHSLLNIFT